MASEQTLNDRLISLARLLERLPAPTSSTASEGNPAARLAGIADERLRLLSGRLKQRLFDREMDAEDALLLRLLLDDYTAAVRQLRSVVHSIDRRLSAVRDIAREGRRTAALTRARAVESPPRRSDAQQL